MRKDDLIRLRHMLDAARDAVSFSRNKSRVDLNADRIVTLSLVKSIEIVGEAASKVTQECRDKASQIAWANIIGMRNRLIHAYYDINLDTVWSTVTEDLPPLIRELERLIASERGE